MPLYPDLSGAKIIGFDLETYDPMLDSMGNGVYRRDGNILGVSFAVDGFKEYYGLRHPGISAEERAANERYIKDVSALPIPKVGANVLYDMDWEENWANWLVNGKVHDVQYAEPLLTTEANTPWNHWLSVFRERKECKQYRAVQSADGLERAGN